MKSNCGPVRMLALAALLALFGGACAGTAGIACAPHTKPPKITVSNYNYYTLGRYFKSYGEDIILQCSSNDSAHLEIQENGKFLQLLSINTTTFQCIKKSNIGVYNYSCVDSDTGCEDSLVVEVRPAMFVESPMVHLKIRDIFHYYYLPLGEDYEVFCIRNDNKTVLTKDGVLLQPEVINSTTIKYKTRADSVGYQYYSCGSNGTTRDQKMNTWIRVKVDYYPECHNFWCLIYEINTFNCSWIYSVTDEVKYKLFYTDQTNGETTLLCSDNSGTAAGTCTVNDDFMDRKLFFWNHNVSLLIMTCNDFICNNQSFAMNTAAIEKVYPVYDVEVLNTSASSVTLKWDHSMDVDYKLEYRQTMFEDSWRQADSTTPRCFRDDETSQVTCKFEMALPYPDAEYDIRVYARNKETIDDRLWSEPESVLVTTEPRVEECACGAAPDAAAEPTATTSAEKALCELCTLTEYAMKKDLALKNKIKSLKKKLNKIKKIMEAKKLLNSEN